MRPAARPLQAKRVPEGHPAVDGASTFRLRSNKTLNKQCSPPTNSTAHHPDTLRQQLLETASGRPFYNTSKLDFERLLDDPNLLAQNLNAYIHGFSENVQEIIERFGFSDHIARMDEKNLLYEVIKVFAGVDLSMQRVDNMQMGYVFEELIRIGAEQSNEEAGEHFHSA